MPAIVDIPLDQIVPAVQALGRRHAGYGVREPHYATVGEALLWSPATLDRVTCDAP
jgi:hemoglobin-like flavoprotein